MADPKLLLQPANCNLDTSWFLQLRSCMEKFKSMNVTIDFTDFKGSVTISESQQGSIVSPTPEIRELQLCNVPPRLNNSSLKNGFLRSCDPSSLKVNNVEVPRKSTRVLK